MARKNLLFLHEAIVIALINQPIRIASFEEIAKFIEDRNLFPHRKGNIPLATQIMLRSTKSNGAYQHLFKQISPHHISFRDSYADFPIQLSNALDDILNQNNDFVNPTIVPLKVVDIKHQENREIEINPANVLCIQALDSDNKKTGRKKYMYLQEKNLKGEEIIGIYTIQQSIENLYKLIDPLCNYLAIVSDNTLVNVGFYEISKHKTLKPILENPIIANLPTIKFSESKVAKSNREKFDLIQRHYLNRISLQKTILGYKNDFGL